MSKIAIVLLAFSPVGYLAMPLAIAHQVYYGVQHKNELEVYYGFRREDEPGDLIVAVAGQRVRDAHEFNDLMRRFGAGDTVAFEVQRGDSRIRLSAQLEAEP